MAKKSKTLLKAELTKNKTIGRLPKNYNINKHSEKQLKKKLDTVMKQRNNKIALLKNKINNFKNEITNNFDDSKLKEIKNEIDNTSLFTSDKNEKKIKKLRLLKNKISQPNKTLKLNIDKNISIFDILDELHETKDFYPVLIFDGQYYVLTNENKRRLLKKIDPIQVFYGKTAHIEEEETSDGQIYLKLTGHINNTVQVKYILKSDKKRNGNFFKYLHKLNLDLSRYQIFKNIDPNNYQDTCLIYALKQSGQLSIQELQDLKLVCIGENIPIVKFKNYIEKLENKFSVELTTKINNETKNKTVKTIYNPGCERVIKVGLLDGHYFINEKTNVTSYSINHYDNIKDINEWNKIYSQEEDGHYHKTDKRFIDSFELIKLLLENKDQLLEPITLNNELLSTVHLSEINNNVSNIKDLYYNETLNTKEIIYKSKENDYSNIIFFDFETDTLQAKHEPYLICYTDKQNNICHKFGKYCAYDFLDSLPNNSLCIAHNLGYDMCFIIENLSAVTNIIRKSNSKIINVTGYYKGKKLTFHDSYALIPKPLREFNEMFNLGNCDKEILPYALYTGENLNKKSIKIQEANEILIKEGKEKEIINFNNNIDKWNLRINNDEFDHLEYTKIYCIQDVNVLRKGYEIFRTWIKEITELDINQYCTLASISYDYLLKEDCFKNCYYLSGIPQLFIQNFIIGGRCMTKDNEKQNVKMDLNDFDACSLYPSAMKRMTGFLKGTPKVIPDDMSEEEIMNMDSYFVEVNVTKINKKLHFPLLSFVNDEGVRMFSNETGTYYLDKTELEDAITYQNIEYEIKRGYYFNEGHNDKINKVIEYLYNKRVEMKNKKNPIQEVYKQIMNSCYGKTCLKPIDEETIIINSDKINNFFDNNYKNTVLYEQLGKNKTIVKMHKPINKHFNACHIGCEILSTSKRIMNEVMTLAENLNIDIFYQDTDSIHIDNNKIDLLSKEFKQKYNRDLIGKGMGQFHCDFDDKKFKSEKSLKSVESLLLSKKMYIDKIEMTRDNKIYYDYHFRMKGIPNDLIDFQANKMNISIFELYEKLYNGDLIEFNLLETPKRVFFETSFNFEITNTKTFTRAVTLDKEKLKQFRQDKKQDDYEE